MIIQFTLVSEKYKPISTLLTVPSIEEFQRNREEYRQQAVDKICVSRKTTRYWLRNYGYTSMKMRVYDKAKIEQENKERYEKIKAERGWK